MDKRYLARSLAAERDRRKKVCGGMVACWLRVAAILQRQSWNAMAWQGCWVGKMMDDSF
jgi:hypothetical protein